MEMPDQGSEDDVARDRAKQTERENPDWIVLFGSYTKEFVCFPRFAAPPGTVLVAQYPGALPSRMRAVERALRITPHGGKPR